MNHSLLPAIGTARLPENFTRAKTAMSACLKATSAEFPAKYEAAKVALRECDSVDECASWPDKLAALASYARQSNDKSLERMALRIMARLETELQNERAGQ